MTTPLKIDHALTASRTSTRRFCSRCGEAGEPPPARHQALRERRVCGACGMGLMLSCPGEAVPGAGAAFVIATADLCVSAVSGAAEMLFGLEEDLLGCPLVSLMNSSAGRDRLTHAVSSAAVRNRPPSVLTVRGLTANSRGVGLLAARICTCGPPRGALITVGPSTLTRI